MPAAARKAKRARIPPGPVIRLAALAQPKARAPETQVGSGPKTLTEAVVEAVVTVPGSQVPLLPLDLPKGLREQAREQVARRQLADRTGLPQDSLSLRPFLPRGGRQNPDSWTRVMVADQVYLQTLAGISCRAVLPDYLTLPTSAGLWSLRLEPETQNPEADTPEAGDPNVPTQMMVRLGPEDGFGAQSPIALALLRQALQTPDPQISPPRAILLQQPDQPGPAGKALQAEIETLAAEHDIPLITQPEAAPALGLARPAVFAHGELDCDLRHNPMAARARLAAAVLPWRWPLLALALAASLWAAAQLIQLDQLQTERRTAEASAQALVKTHFIPAAPVLDARLQVSRALEDLRRAKGAAGSLHNPLELTARVAQVLAAADLRPDLLSYHSDSGLLLVLRLADFAAADRLATALQAADLSANLVESQVSEDSQGVRAEFVITPGPAASAAALGETRP